MPSGEDRHREEDRERGICAILSPLRDLFDCVIKFGFDYMNTSTGSWCYFLCKVAGASSTEVRGHSLASRVSESSGQGQISAAEWATELGFYPELASVGSFTAQPVRISWTMRDTG